MSVIYSTAVKTSRMSAVVSAIGSAGTLEIGTTSMASVLATISLANPAGNVNNGVLTFTMPRSDANADASGTAAAARIRNSVDGDVITGLTVGLPGSSADIILDNTNIAINQIVTCNSAVIYHG